MKHVDKPSFKERLNKFYLSYIPNPKDNRKQIFSKSLFLISLITLIVSLSVIANHFLTATYEDNVVKESRKIWHSENLEDYLDEHSQKNELLLKENGDFKGWITVPNTKIDYPIYQTKDNEFYLNHNQNKKKSVYGALFFDYNNVIIENERDINLVIFGHNMNNGSMFGELKKYKSLAFYKENPTIEFSTLYDSSTYQIFSVFLLNSKKADDNGYFYNIYRNSFSGSEDFKAWIDESLQRSIIDTSVEVSYQDEIITLITCSDDIKDGRLVVMARKVRDTETVDTTKAKVNPNPRYPKIWYDKNKLDYPFD